MTIDELKIELDKDEQWGFVKATEDSNYLGWVLLSKRFIPPPESVGDPRDGDVYFQLKEHRKECEEKPYHIAVRELRRDAHESEDYESNEDYRVIENYYYSTLSEAVKKIEEMGYDINNIENGRKIDAP